MIHYVLKKWGGELFPPPHYTDRIVTDWWVQNLELETLVDRLSRGEVEQVEGGFLSNTEKLALAVSLGDCWYDCSPNLVSNWSTIWDKKLSGEGPRQNSMVESFKRPRNFGITYPEKMGGELFPPPHYTNRVVTVLPNTKKLTLATFGEECWPYFWPEVGFRRVDDSFPPKLHKPYSSRKPTPHYWSKWEVTWLRTWDDNPSQWDSAVSIPRELKATTPQKSKVNKDSCVGRNTDKRTKYPNLKSNSGSKQKVRVTNYRRYPIGFYQFRPRRRKKRNTLKI